MPSISIEDYIKAISQLSGKKTQWVKTSSISERLDIKPGSVTEMLKRLSKDGYLDHAPYKGVKLTPKGKKMGLTMVRRHRVIEQYLHKELGFKWNEVHDEAERLEHAASDELINRMHEKLGFPDFDPHGSPIPSASGQLPSSS